MRPPDEQNEADPRDDDIREADDVDPKTGRSDDPRVDPRQAGPAG